MVATGFDKHKMEDGRRDAALMHPRRVLEPQILENALSLVSGTRAKNSTVRRACEGATGKHWR
jgi:hypothetical protein